ncbi:hypothetical protein ACVGWV_09240, partial [Enterobacter asburiae]
LGGIPGPGRPAAGIHPHPPRNLAHTPHHPQQLIIPLEYKIYVLMNKPTPASKKKKTTKQKKYKNT